MQLAPQHDEAVVSAQLLGFKADLGLEECGQQFKEGRQARSLPPARSDSLSLVHADKVLGAHGNGERLSSARRTGRVYLRVARGALASGSSRDEARLVASNFNVLAAKIRSKQECAFRRNTAQALPRRYH